MLNVFFSHCTADKEWVQHIARGIASEGIHIYLYENDSQPGVLISEKVQKAINRAHVAVVLLTKHSHNAAYVQQEIGYAEGKGKLVVPLVEKGIPKRSLGMLAGREYITFDVNALEDCIAALSAYLVARVAAGIAGMSAEQVLQLLLALALIALGCYLIYTIGKSGIS